MSDNLISLGVWLLVLSIYQGAFGYIYAYFRHSKIVKYEIDDNNKLSRRSFIYFLSAAIFCLVFFIVSFLAAINGLYVGLLIPLVTVVNMIILYIYKPNNNDFSVYVSIGLPVISFKNKTLNLILGEKFIIYVSILLIIAGSYLK